MFNEQANNEPEQKKAPDTAAEQKENQKQAVTKMVQDVPPSVDATPLSDRKRPQEAEKPGVSVDISDSVLFRQVNENVLSEAKKNMTQEAEYGNTSEITVDNTQFILTKDNAGIPYICINVYGLSSGALISQNIYIQEQDSDGALAYINPPVPKEDEQFVDDTLKRIA